MMDICPELSSHRAKVPIMKKSNLMMTTQLCHNEHVLIVDVAVMQSTAKPISSTMRRD